MASTNKFLELYEPLDNAQKRRFARYLRTDYFAHPPELSDAHRHLGKLDNKPEFYRMVLGADVPFREVRLRRILSDLTQALFDFLALEHFRTDPAAPVLRAFECIDQPEHEKHRRTLARRLESTLERSPLRDAAHEWTRYRFATLRDFHHRRAQPDRSELTHLHHADRALDAFYLAEKLRHYCESAALTRIRADRVPVRLHDFHLELAARFQDHPAVRAYTLLARMNRAPDHLPYFREFRAFFREDIHRFPRPEQTKLFVHALNYCIDTKVNAGRPEFFHEIFDLYRDALATEMLLEHQALPPAHYKNIITVGIRVDELDWTERFIQDWTDRLPAAHRADAEEYNLAKIAYQRGDYPRTIEHLRAVTDRNDRYALGGRLLLLKAYYQLEETRALDSLLHSFRLYLRRHPRISREVREQYYLVLRFFKKLARLNQYDRGEIDTLRAEIEAADRLPERAWFREVVGSLG